MLDPHSHVEGCIPHQEPSLLSGRQIWEQTHRSLRNNFSDIWTGNSDALETVELSRKGCGGYGLEIQMPWNL